MLRYLQGTIGYGLQYLGEDGVRLQGYSDSDWVGSDIDWKSTFGCCFSLGSTVFSCFSRKHISIALSSAEVGYMAASLASCEELLTGLFGHKLEPTMIRCDNRSCIKLSENPVFHGRSNHIEIKYDFIKERMLMGAVKLQYISIEE